MDTCAVGKKENQQINAIEQSLFWNYVHRNWRYVQVLMVWTFPCIFLTGKSAVQASELHNSLAQQYLETAL